MRNADWFEKKKERRRRATTQVDSWKIGLSSCQKALTLQKDALKFSSFQIVMERAGISAVQFQKSQKSAVGPLVTKK